MHAYDEEYHPSVDYDGIVGVEMNGSPALQVRSPQPFYMVLNLIEPRLENSHALDFDMYTTPADTIELTWQ